MFEVEGFCLLESSVSEFWQFRVWCFWEVRVKGLGV